MALSAGTRLGSYEILAPIGAGGMGEVYRARDTKLGRQVAIKVLPEAFSTHKERLARFKREARLLAALNHPNIATLYGLEESNGIRFLVMELVEGETLAELISKGPIPVEEALLLFKQIAEGLEAAHEKGVVHRDLKPANIKITPDGKPKILDFGLAKAYGAEFASSVNAESPTVTREGTQAGVMLGTAAYMSPEQARGKPLDKRTDVWSFGGVLFEALTGHPAFLGETVSDTIASILEREPNWDELPAATPQRISRLLRRCLEKDARQRVRDIGDARLAMEGAFETAPQTPEAVSARQPAGWRRAMPFVATAVGAALAAGLVGWGLTRPARSPIARFVLTAPPSQVVFTDTRTTDLAISPDGARVVYTSGSTSELYVRAIDQLEGAPLRDTSGARGPFFSPDGSWVGFRDTAERALKKVPVLGEPPVTVCAVNSELRGASWGPDDTIIFAESARGGLLRVPAAGGEPEVLTTPDSDAGEVAHLWPEVLPGGRAVLFTRARGFRDADRQIAVLNLATREQVTLVPVGSNARYSATGHIVYGLGGTLRAVAFDLDGLEVSGNTVVVLEDVMTKSTEAGRVNPLDGARNFSLAQDGSLVYIPETGGAGAPKRTLVWVDRQGREEPLTAEPRTYQIPRISPDGRRVALDLRDQENDIWIWDLAAENLTRLTFDPAPDYLPVWTRDGRLVFASRRDGPGLVFVKAADGAGVVERLSDRAQLGPRALSPDGEHLVLMTNASGVQNLVVMAMAGEHSVRGLLETRFAEHDAAFSPDGRWLAYQSDQSGRPEIYVKPFPQVDDGRWQISTAGGIQPLWNPEGRELLYRDLDGRLMAAPVRAAGGPLTHGRPEVLLERTYFIGSVHSYDISPDGQRFLMIKEDPSLDENTESGRSRLPPFGETPDIILVQNWSEELKQRVPIP